MTTVTMTTDKPVTKTVSKLSAVTQSQHEHITFQITFQITDVCTKKWCQNQLEYVEPNVQV